MQQRRAVNAACSRDGTGDLDLSLVMADGSCGGRTDPAFHAHSDPMSHWAEAVWSQWLPRVMLEELMQHACDVIKAGENHWPKARGPATGFVASALRLEWTIQSAFECTDDQGLNIIFTRDSPQFVKSKVEESVRRWRWRRIEAKFPSLSQGAGGLGAHMAPIFKVINCKRTSDNWGCQEVGALRSAITGRQWPQSRLHRANLVSSPVCRLCIAARLCDEHSTDPWFRGTLVHRLWTCKCLQPLRTKLVSKWLLKKVRSLIRADGTIDPGYFLLYTRALMPSLCSKITPKPENGTFNWVTPPPIGGVPKGRVYCDGSKLYATRNTSGIFASLGWAFAVVDASEFVVASASGIPPKWVEGIYGAELWALLSAAQHCSPGSPFYIDCKAVQLGAKNGPEWAGAPVRKLGRAWIPLADILHDSDSDVNWMPAHCTFKDIGIAR